MKKINLVILLCCWSFLLSGQQNIIPAVDLRDLDGRIVSSSEVIKPGAATLLVFWKSSSGKCCENLETLQEAWESSLKDQNIRLVAVCVDCNGSWSHVKPIVNAENWEFDTYVDVNGDFKRALCVGEAPCSMLFDSEQNLVCRYNSACTGSSEFVCKNILGHINLADNGKK